MEVHDTVQETGIKTNPKKKKCKKAKWVSKETLQISVKRREVKSKGEKERYTQAKNDKKAFLRYQCKEIEENNKMGKIRDLFNKIKFPGEASVYNVGDRGSIPGSGRSAGEGNGNPLQYYCLENPMHRGAW